MMKPRKRIHLSFQLIVAVFFLCTGLIFLLRGGYLGIKAFHAIPLEMLTEEKCAGKPYVYGYIDSYVGKMEENGVGLGVYTGRSSTWIKGIPSLYYDVYTVPVADHRYIAVSIYHKKKLEQLKQYSQGKVTDREKGRVYFEGVVNTKYGLPDKYWLSTTEELGGERVSRVIDGYGLVERRLHEWAEWLGAGVAMIAMAVLILQMNGGKEGVVGEIIPEPDPWKKKKAYNYESELKAEKLRQEMLERRLEELRRARNHRWIFLIIGLYFIVFSSWTIDRMVGMFIILPAIPGFVRYWRERGGKIAEKILRMSGQESLHTQIENSKKRQIKLKELIAEEEPQGY